MYDTFLNRFSIYVSKSEEKLIKIKIEFRLGLAQIVPTGCTSGSNISKMPCQISLNPVILRSHSNSSWTTIYIFIFLLNFIILQFQFHQKYAWACIFNDFVALQSWRVRFLGLGPLIICVVRPYITWMGHAVCFAFSFYINIFIFV